MVLIKEEINTPIGKMLAIADENFLYFLDFIDSKSHDNKINKLLVKLKEKNLMDNRSNKIIDLLSHELALYFKGDLKNFETPIATVGTDFQQKAWSALIKIPYGATITYQNQAISLNSPKSYRAVANSNGCNLISIVIPCHRVVRSTGDLGGYAGGVERKKWLLNLEKL